MLQPLKDMYLVSADESANDKTASGLIIDTSWDKYAHAVQRGVIESIPLQVSKSFKNDVEIKAGDKGYFHHFVVQPDNFVTNGSVVYYKCPRFHLYCVVQDGEIVMLDDWLLASPIMESEDEITKTFGTLKLWTKAMPDKVHFQAKAEHISKEGERQGLKVGDTIVFRKDADYEMEVEGSKYYRMKLANVVAVFRGDELLPLRDEIMIENTSKQEEVRPSGLIIPKLRKERQQTEKIVAIGGADEEKEFKIGDEVSLFWYTGSGVDHKGKNYIFLRQEEIIGKFIPEEV